MSVAGPAPDVGIVIATRDRRDSLLRTLTEIQALPERPPTVVVDNASADGTAGAVISAFPAVELIELERNRGAFARNLGAARLRTPFVAFSDDDSWWEPGALARAAATLRRHAAVGLLAARILVGEERRLDPVSILMAAGPAPAGLPGPRVDGFLACGAIVRRDAFLASGGFCERFLIGAEESLLAIDLRRAGWELCYDAEVTAIHQPHRASRGDRAWLRLRNDLWTSWLRMPVGRALRDTAALARAAARDAAARRALFSATAGLPWALGARRVGDWPATGPSGTAEAADPARPPLATAKPAVPARKRKDGWMPRPRRPEKRSEPEDHGWVISFGCKPTGTLRRLKVDTDPAADTRPIEVPCLCGEVHRVTVSPYRRRRSAEEPFDLEVASLDELR